MTVRQNCSVHTKNRFFAIALQINKADISAAMNGNDNYLTKNLFRKYVPLFPRRI